MSQLLTRAQLTQILDFFQSKGRSAYRLLLDEGQCPTIFNSKLGGIPYLRPDQAYPTAQDGSGLHLLAQINFAEFPHPVHSPLPQSGLLQFFIKGDDDLGCRYGEPGGDFKVIYHPTLDLSLTEQQSRLILQQGHFSQADIDHWSSFMVGSCALKAQSFCSLPDVGDYNSYSKTLLEILQQMNFKVESMAQVWDMFGAAQTEIEDALEQMQGFTNNDTPNSGRNSMLGYPFFVQNNPLQNHPEFDTLLLQIDSCASEKRQFALWWQDSGIGNFFIESAALARCDFSKVCYNWGS